MTGLTFLGTGGAWRLPEIGCDCQICKGMRLKKEERRRTALFLSGSRNILIDCGPDIREQLIINNIDSVDAILITHEHGDHYLGLDEISCFKRRRPRDEFEPIPLYATKKAWQTIAAQFKYLADIGVIKVLEIEAKTLNEMVNSCIVPNAFDYQGLLARNLRDMLELQEKAGVKFNDAAFGDLKTHLAEVTEMIYYVRKNANEMVGFLEKAHAGEEEERAKRFFAELKPLMEHIRRHADALEQVISDEHWDLPKYREMLFIK